MQRVTQTRLRNGVDEDIAMRVQIHVCGEAVVRCGDVIKRVGVTVYGGSVIEFYADAI